MTTAPNLILALDQGTTSSRAILFDGLTPTRWSRQREFPQVFPRHGGGWVEHDPEAIWSTQLQVACETIRASGTKPGDIAALGITNQRETTIVWDRSTGRPIHNAIVWQDRRTADLCERLKSAGHEPTIREKTGLLIDPYFSATKIAWMLENVPDARARAEAGELAFGTVDSWLVWKLTQGRVHATDATNASRTMLFNIHTGQWDDELLRLLGIPRAVLPEVRGCSEVYGEVSGITELEGVKIAGIAGDQQAALFGQACFKPGMVKNTYGTGCFLLQHLGDKRALSRHRLVTTTAWRIADKTEYAMEGSVFIGGAVVQWLRDGLGIIKKSADVEPLASSVPDTGGVYLVPAFAGLGAPHWDAAARGLIIGLTRSTTAAHIARAAVESIAFQVADVLEALEADSGIAVPEVRVDGGASADDLLMQFQADLLRRPVVRSAVQETTAFGAAALAGLAVGVLKDRDQVSQAWKSAGRFEPKLPEAQARNRRARWCEAVERAKGWEHPPT